MPEHQDHPIDFTDIIERLESTEEECNIAISSLSAIYRRIDLVSRLVVSGDIIFDNIPTKRRYPVRICIALYDAEGMVEAKESAGVGEIGCNYDAFSIHILPKKQANWSKIRIWASKC
jgi:hypothetical protein